jgi:hypothetical protein
MRAVELLFATEAVYPIVTVAVDRLAAARREERRGGVLEEEGKGGIVIGKRGGTV